MKFSITTPSFNQGKFLEKTIESVISQKGNFDIEYFVMDGGSTDNTLEIINKYDNLLKNNSRIKFYWQSKKDEGQVDAINQGLSKSKGEIFAFINSDDYYLPGAFKLIDSFFNRNIKNQWVVGNCIVSSNKLKWTFWLKHIWPIQISKYMLIMFNTINQPSVFLKKSLVDKVGFFDEKLHFAFDYDYWLRCIKYSLPGRIHKNLSIFRIHEQSKGNTGFYKQFSEDIEIVKKYTNSKILLWIHSFGKKLVEFNYKKLKS